MMRDLTELIDKNSHQIKTHDFKFNDVKKFMERRREEQNQLQEVLDTFKDRIVDKFKTMSDEFTTELKALDKRYFGLNDSINLLKKRFEIISTNS